MSDRVEILLLELLELARGQRAALMAGRLDEALSFLGKRGIIFDRMRDIGRLTESQKMAVKDILSIDADISAAVRRSKADIASRLDSLEKVKAYLHSVSSKSEEKQVGVAS